MKKLNLKATNFKHIIAKSKFITLNLDGNKTNPEITGFVNPWGIDRKQLNSEKNFVAKIKESSKSLNFDIHIGDVDTKGYIAGYPSIIIGQNPWRPGTNIIFGKVKEYKKIKITTEFDFITKNNANFTYDIWLSKKSEKGLASNSIEIMIWLDYKFTPPWKSLGSFKEFNVLYKKKGKEFWGGSHVFAFFSKSKKKKISFDLKEMIDFCKRKVKTTDDYYIKSIELGTEFPKKSKIQAKLYKLNLDIKTKKKGLK